MKYKCSIELDAPEVGDIGGEEHVNVLEANHSGIATTNEKDILTILSDDSSRIVDADGETSRLLHLRVCAVHKDGDIRIVERESTIIAASIE